MDIDVRKHVLPWIKGDATDAVLIVEHPDNERLVCDSQGFHYFDPEKEKNRRLRGLTGPLAELFWPDQLLPVVRAAYPTNHRRPVSAQTAARGLLRGNLIHSQIQALVSLDAEHFHRKYTGGAHPWSYDALDALLGRGIRPLDSEVGIADVDIGKATNIDLIGVRENGRLVFIEWKTGYEGEAWTSATHWMRGPLRGVLEDSAKNRAIVQVVLGALMARNSRGLSDDFECWVVHISSQGTEFIPVKAEFILEYGPRLYRALARHQLIARTKKKEEAGKRRRVPQTQRNVRKKKAIRRR
jgi:hypothetical protein